MKKSQVGVGSNFMDSIFNSLKELKHERSCLAQRLNELQTQRQGLEQDFDQTDNKYSQVRIKHQRISGAYAIAQKKMDQCIVSSSRIQEEIDKQKIMKKSLEEEYEFEKNSHTEYINRFKLTLSEIADNLFEARNSYRETALMDTISETEKIQQETKIIVEQEDKQIQELNRCIEHLSVAETSCQGDGDVEFMVNFIIRAVQVDIKESEEHLHQLQAEMKGVHGALQSTESSA